CIVSNQRPRITFNEQGVCSACQYAEDQRTTVDWRARENELNTLLDKHRKPSGYDVIVPSSGGKDSAMVAHRLKHEYGMHPLCITWAPFIYTEVGRRNFDAFVQSGFDCITMFPNGLIHRKLARLSLEYIGDPFQAFVYGQLCWPMNAASHFNVPLVMAGENGEASYGGDTSANERPCWGNEDWDRVYAKGANIWSLIQIGLDVGALSNGEMREASPFYSLPGNQTEAFRSVYGRGLDCEPEFHWFGYYRQWHPMENFYYVSEKTGFEPNEERSVGTYTKFASIDDKMDNIHKYFSFVKFGIGRCNADASQQVRAGDIDRDEALALVARYDGEFPERHLDECLEYLGMDREQFDRVVERFSMKKKPKTSEEIIDAAAIKYSRCLQNLAAR
ncbi:MAG TPA: N-acetyl sugar amidotransferase, partial [Marinobacter sp.]|nr:N-acetyl sugar amidotransferase [Marinobacter sp.]